MLIQEHVKWALVAIHDANVVCLANQLEGSLILADVLFLSIVLLTIKMHVVHVSIGA